MQVVQGNTTLSAGHKVRLPGRKMEQLERKQLYSWSGVSRKMEQPEQDHRMKLVN